MMQRGRRALGRVAGLTITITVLLGACTSSSPHRGASRSIRPASSRPNIVLVLTDDLSSNLVQYMPHVQAMEQAGTSLSHYFVVDSLCCPSRSALFTGQYPHNDGVFTNSGNDGGYATFERHGDAAKSFVVGLHAAGYRTGLMGKYLNGYRPTDHSDPGWDEWDVSGNGYAEFNYLLSENGTVQRYGRSKDDYLTDVLSAKAGNFVDTATQAGKPFALEVATFAPHRPWVPAPRDDGTFPVLRAPRGPAYGRVPTRAPQWLTKIPRLSAADGKLLDLGFRKRVESVQAIDALIGHLQQVLVADGVAQNTYVVFSSDNGYHMGEYRLLPGKQTAFDTDIRVPLVVTGPGVLPGARVSAMTSSIDLSPTFAQIAGVAPTGEPDGTSLVALLHGQPAPPDWQRAVLIEHHGPVTDPKDPDVQPIRSGDPPSYEAMRTPTALYVEYRDGEREYYDLTRDVNELHNLGSALPPHRLDLLHRTLLALEACKGVAACQAAARMPLIA
jgi:arylsulfatase A-like enzyme